jgi:hypothetical protein
MNGMLGKVLLGRRFTCADFALRVMALGVAEWKRHNMELAKMHGRGVFDIVEHGSQLSRLTS